MDAARNGDFIEAKRIFDEQVSQNSGQDAKTLLQSTDGRGRNVAHYAVLYDDVIVAEWLFNMGCDFFARDDTNKSAIETAVLVDMKMNKKLNKSSEVMQFIKSKVLNSIQEMFYLESAESTQSVGSVGDLESLSLEKLSEKFPYYNNMQAIHLFAFDNRLDELRFLKSRGIDMTATDDDGKNIVHFSGSCDIVEFALSECGLFADCKTGDGDTIAHVIVENISSDQLEKEQGLEMLKCLANHGADFSIKSEGTSLNVFEMAMEYIGQGKVSMYCAERVSEKTGVPIQQMLQYKPQFSDSASSDISVASHDNRVLNEDGVYSDEDDESSYDEAEEDDDDRSASSSSEDEQPMFGFRKK